MQSEFDHFHSHQAKMNRPSSSKETGDVTLDNSLDLEQSGSSVIPLKRKRSSDLVQLALDSD